MKFLLTTNVGIEDIVKKEIKENFKAKIFPKFFGLQGRVLIETKEKNLEKIFKLRSIYHVTKFIDSFEIETKEKGLQTIYENLKRIEIEDMKKAKSFRVTGERIGKHEFTSIQVQKFAGQALVEKYGKKVDLENFDVNVFVEVIGRKCWVGVRLTRESLHKRFKKPFNHPAAIKAPLAYAMLRLAEVKEGETILDPFCGGATLPIEAAQVYDEKIRIFASDISKKFLEDAKKNAKAAKVKKYIKFKICDARRLEECYNFEINKIITNPPYGVRMGKGNLKPLYSKFLVSALKILSENGKIVIINLKANSFRNIVFKTKKFSISHERVVEAGGLYPHIFVLERI